MPVESLRRDFPNARREECEVGYGMLKKDPECQKASESVYRFVSIRSLCLDFPFIKRDVPHEKRREQGHERHDDEEWGDAGMAELHGSICKAVFCPETFHSVPRNDHAVMNFGRRFPPCRPQKNVE